MTTIAWRLAHLIVGFAGMNGTCFGGPPVTMTSFSYAGTATEALRQPDDAHGMWIGGVRGRGVPGLPGRRARRCHRSSPVHLWPGRVLYTSVEVFHHGAEICLLRDLYLRNRP